MDPITAALLITLAREGLRGAISIIRSNREPVTNDNGTEIAPNIGALMAMRESAAIFEEVMGRPRRPDEEPGA